MPTSLSHLSIRPLVVAAVSTALLYASPSFAQNQTVPGAGNSQAIKTAQASPLVNRAYEFLVGQTFQLSDRNLRNQTLDALSNTSTCILHRANLKPEEKQSIVSELLTQGLLNPADDTTFPGGLLVGVFPPVLDDPSPCPHLPQRFWSAPGSTFGGHHSYPGGLPVHEANNDTADINLAASMATSTARRMVPASQPSMLQASTFLCPTIPRRMLSS